MQGGHVPSNPLVAEVLFWVIDVLQAGDPRLAFSPWVEAEIVRPRFLSAWIAPIGLWGAVILLPLRQAVEVSVVMTSVHDYLFTDLVRSDDSPIAQAYGFKRDAAFAATLVALVRTAVDILRSKS